MAQTKIDMLAWMSSENPVDLLEKYVENGMLAEELPEVFALQGVPQNPLHHPEVDTFIHVKMALRIATALSVDPRVRFATLVHDLGKGLTPKDELPRHINHEKNGVELVRQVAERFNVPDDWAWLGMVTSRWHLEVHRSLKARAGPSIKLIVKAEFLDKPDLFNAFLLACEADKRGRLGMEEDPYPQVAYMKEVYKVVESIPGGVPFSVQKRVLALKPILAKYTEA